MVAITTPMNKARFTAVSIVPPTRRPRITVVTTIAVARIGKPCGLARHRARRMQIAGITRKRRVLLLMIGLRKKGYLAGALPHAGQVSWPRNLAGYLPLARKAAIAPIAVPKARPTY
jgi:hypothetical protein